MQPLLGNFVAYGRQISNRVFKYLNSKIKLLAEDMVCRLTWFRQFNEMKFNCPLQGKIKSGFYF